MKDARFAPMMLAAACASLQGCASIQNSLGVSKRAPDEFKVVTKAPLVIPPEYHLRPPTPGEYRPAELRPDADARKAVFGTDIGATATDAEKAFVVAAGADVVDADVRAKLDFEGAQVVRKKEEFADKVLAFVSTSPKDQAVALDPEAEARRLADEKSVRDATGGLKPTIEKSEPRIRLPGL